MAVLTFDSDIIIPLGEHYGLETFMKFRRWEDNKSIPHLTLYWLVYAEDAGDEVVSTNMVNPYEVSQSFSNLTLVDADTGEVVPPPDQETYLEDMMGQYDFYWRQFFAGPIDLESFIRERGTELMPSVVPHI